MNHGAAIRSLAAATVPMLVGLGSTSAFAEDFVVSNLSQINSALDDAGPGDTIIMTDGVWTNQAIKFQGNGAAGQPLTLRAETPGGVILNGSSRLEIGGAFLVVEGLRFEGGSLDSGHVIRFSSGDVESTDSVLRDTAIIDYNPADRNTRYFWVSLFGLRNTVENCYFENQDHSGVTVCVWGDWPNNHVIRNNHFVDRPEGPENGWETIRVGTSEVIELSSQTLVESNLFERTDGEIEVISNKSGDNVYRWNTFREMAATLTLRHSYGATVEGNFFLGENVSRSGGVRVIGPGHRVYNNYFERLEGRTGGIIALEAGEPNAPDSGYQPVTDAIIAHNTFVDCEEPAFIISRSLGSDGRTIPPTDVMIVGNLISTPGEVVATGTGGVIDWADNIAFGSGRGTAPSSGVTVVASDPMFSSTDGFQRPANGGPADNAVSPTVAIATFDIEGQTRSSPSDAGADEISAAAALRGPLTAADVGVSWDLTVDPGPIGPDATLGAFIEAEEPSAILDPDSDGVVFFVREDSIASGGAVLRSPDASRTNIGGDETVAVYDVEFPSAGVYRVYYKARGFSGSSDSFFRPTGFGVVPTEIETTSSNGVFNWEEGPQQFTVPDPSVSYELRIGRREEDVEIDAIIFFPGASLTQSDLDLLLAAGPPEPCGPDLNGDFRADAFDMMVYLALYEAGDLAADTSGNGALETTDIVRYVLRLEAGCD